MAALDERDADAAQQRERREQRHDKTKAEHPVADQADVDEQRRQRRRKAPDDSTAGGHPEARRENGHQSQDQRRSRLANEHPDVVVGGLDIHRPVTANQLVRHLGLERQRQPRLEYQ